MEKNILIIEDDPALQHALTDALTRAGYACVAAEDGEAGLRLAQEQHPALILLDLLLPRMDGMTMLKQLRHDPWGKTALVLILTNLSADNAQMIHDAVETFPEYYLVKSDWTIDDILKKVGEILAAKYERNTQ
jgi:DNA-binding response OmpR family regulator